MEILSVASQERARQSSMDGGNGGGNGQPLSEKGASGPSTAGQGGHDVHSHAGERMQVQAPRGAKPDIAVQEAGED